jgi:hypothetical protein
MGDREMAKIPKRKSQNRMSSQPRSTGEKLTNIATNQSVEKELNILEKLSDWHKRSNKTKWIIGEYLGG